MFFSKEGPSWLNGALDKLKIEGSFNADNIGRLLMGSGQAINGGDASKFMHQQPSAGKPYEQYRVVGDQLYDLSAAGGPRAINGPNAGGGGPDFNSIMYGASASGGENGAGATAPTGDNGFVRYANDGAIRNKPLNAKLVNAMGFLGDMGITMEVFSGGQDAKGSGGSRTGSTRHDHGNAADAYFYKDGRKLDWANPADRPYFEQIVTRARANGVTGIGAGDGYMGAGSMHIGFGDEAVWGAGGKGENASEWLRAAYNAKADPHAGHNHDARPRRSFTEAGAKAISAEGHSQPVQVAARGGNGAAVGSSGTDRVGIDELTKRREKYERAYLAAKTPAQKKIALERLSVVNNLVEKQLQSQYLAEPAERKMTKAADGYYYYDGDKERVFPDVVAPKKTSAIESEIEQLQADLGLSREQAVAMAYDVVTISRDPLTGEATLVDKRNVQPPIANEAAQTPTQGSAPQASPAAPEFTPIPNANDAFGAEGTIKGAINNVADVLGQDVPFPNVQEAQTYFDLAGESLLADFSQGYDRQPPGWVMKAIKELIPAAGSLKNGSSKAVSQLSAFERKAQQEIKSLERQQRRKMSPKSKEQVETRLIGARAGLARIQQMKSHLAPKSDVEISPEVLNRLDAYK